MRVHARVHERVCTGARVRACECICRYQEKVAGMFVFVGSRAKGSPLRPHHHPSFDIDEEAMMIGTSFWLELVEQVLCIPRAEIVL